MHGRNSRSWYPPYKAPYFLLAGRHTKHGGRDGCSSNSKSNVCMEEIKGAGIQSAIYEDEG